LVIAGVFPGTPSGAYTIVEPGTIIDGATNGVVVNQSVSLAMLTISGASSVEIIVNEKYDGTSTLTNVRIVSTAISIIVTVSVNFFVNFCYIGYNGASIAFSSALGGEYRLYSSVVSQTGARAGTGVRPLFGIWAIRATAIDNFTRGVLATGNCAVDFFTSQGESFISNCTTGIQAINGASVFSTANNQYAGNTTNESATAASYGYID
jgi:hypothetical protein